MPELASPSITPASPLTGTTPVIELSDGLMLRPWEDADAPAVMRAFEDPLIQKWHMRRADSAEEALGWIVRWRGSTSWAISDTRTRSLLGRVALKNVDYWEGVADVAYWVVPAARGRGLCPIAVAGLSEWAFSAGIHRLQVEHSTLNASSCRVAEKAGFDFEGVRHSAARHADGWHDMHVHTKMRGPVHSTAGEIDKVLALERELQTHACRSNAARLLELLAYDFSEVGASGRMWDRVTTIAQLHEETGSDEIEVVNLTGRVLEANYVQTQWDSRIGSRRARRTSLWRRSSAGWQIVHHQGTPL